MLDKQLNDIIEEYELKNCKAITFAHPKTKMKWVLPLVGATIYSFEQFQPFFVYFDNLGITFFPLNLNNNYKVIGKSFIPWKEIKNFTFKKGLLLEDSFIVELDKNKFEMKIPKSKSMNKWVKENNEYLISNNHFYTK